MDHRPQHHRYQGRHGKEDSAPPEAYILARDLVGREKATMAEKQATPSRREIIKTAGAVTASALAAPLLGTATGASSRAAEIRIGLVGCGGRGTGAAMQALNADPNVVLVSMGDVFAGKIEASINALKGDAKVAPRVRVENNKKFVGLDAYKQVLDSGIDVVLLASPPGFRWREIRAAVEAGKHLFAEKPAAVDPVAVRSVLESAKMAADKKLCWVAGFCWRYEPMRRAMYKRIHAGAIGDITHIHATYITGPVKPMPPASSRPAGMSDVEWQISNWYNFVWLSGDGLVEQACHSVDKIMWAMKDTPPVRCYATGGRVHPNNEGNIFDHIDVFYEFPNGARASMAQRQINNCYSENCDFIAGTKGMAEIASHGPIITGPAAWQFDEKRDGKREDMYQVEHNELFAAIRAGRIINDGARMATSSLAAVMGRMAAYTGKQITWDEAMNSQWGLFPDNLEWNGKLAIDPLAEPGITPFK